MRVRLVRKPTREGRMRRTSSAAIVLAVAALVVPAALGAPPAPPPTLSGEQLVATLTPTTVHARCDPAGGSTLTVATGGVALGPYPGTWSGVITVKIGPQVGAVALVGLLGGTLAEWREDFRVQSAVGTVTGTKTLLADVGNVGQCREFHGEQPPELYGVNLNGYLYAASAQALAYRVAIAAPRGRTYRDVGLASARLSSSHVTCCPNQAGVDLETRSDTHSFQEQFQSTLTTTQELKRERGCGDDQHGDDQHGDDQHGDDDHGNGHGDECDDD
jgi:hypothetical protein